MVKMKDDSAVSVSMNFSIMFSAAMHLKLNRLYGGQWQDSMGDTAMYKIMPLIVASAMVVGACSSIVEGTSQEVVINTNPAGANCDLQREGVSIARVNPTPGAATIKKTKHDITIKCNLPNFHEATYFNKSDAAGATFGNIILGGGIGWAIDSASGADNKYTSPVNVTLVPVTQPAPPPQSSPPATSEPQPAPKEGQSTSLSY